MRDKCDNWAEFNRQALLQSELAQEIKTLVDGINKPGEESVQVRVNGFILLEIPLPKPSSHNSPRRAFRASQLLAASCSVRSPEPQKVMLMLHEDFDFSEQTIQSFLKVHPKYSFFDIIQFFSTAQTLQAYFDRTKKGGKRDTSTRGKLKDHLQWLIENKVLKPIHPHYLLVFAHGPLGSRPVMPDRSARTVSRSTPSQAHHPSVLYYVPSEGLQQTPRPDPSPTSWNPQHRRSTPGHRGSEYPGDYTPTMAYTPPFGSPTLHEDGADRKSPPATLDICEEDWQSLLRLASNTRVIQTNTEQHKAFVFLCENNLLDGKHTRNEIIDIMQRHDLREQLLDNLLHIFTTNGHIVTIWY